MPALREVVDSEWPGAFDQVTWHIDPEAERLTKALSPLTAEVLFHAAREAIRNAARHGRGADAARPLHLRVALIRADGLRLSIEDDGSGIVGQGSSRAAGHGLALHTTLLAIVGGALKLRIRP